MLKIPALTLIMVDGAKSISNIKAPIQSDTKAIWCTLGHKLRGVGHSSNKKGENDLCGRLSFNKRLIKNLPPKKQIIQTNNQPPCLAENLATFIVGP